MNWKKHLPLTISMLLCAVIGVVVGNIYAPKRQTGADRQALLELALPDLQGKQQSLSQWKGKKLLVNFWATWCGPCVREIPVLSGLQKELGNQRIQIIGIGIDSAGNIREFSTKYQIAYPLYVAGMEGADLLHRYGDQDGGLPYTVLIGADGKIIKRYLGSVDIAEVRKDIAG